MVCLLFMACLLFGMCAIGRFHCNGKGRRPICYFSSVSVNYASAKSLELEESI